MVKFTDIQDAFFFVSSAGCGMHSAVLHRGTGQLHYRSETEDQDETSGEDLDRDAWIHIPHKNDLGLGQELVFEFVTDHLADEYDWVRQVFRKRGAYSKFKDLLQSRGLLQAWF